MTDRDLITVVIPNYNGIRYIKACLDSVLAGTMVPQIIVVDNASTDGSAEVIEQDYPQVILLKLKVNTGFCHAVNAGLHLTRTPYVMLLNNDTRLEADCIAHLMDTMLSSGRIFSVQALMLSMQEPEVIDDAGDLFSALGWAFARAKGKPRRKAGQGRPVHIFAACAGAALYRMEVFDQIGWFDERHYCYLEDIDIGWRAQIAGYGNRMEPSAVVYHAGSASSGSRYNAFKETLTPGNNALLMYKNMPLLQYWINAPLRALGRAVKRKYFIRMGLGEAYEQGLQRGAFLKAAAQNQTAMDRAGLPCRKGSLSEEACVALAPAASDTGLAVAAAGAPQETETSSQAGEMSGERSLTLDDVIPLYLGGKVPFHVRALPRYLSIEGQLIAGCVRRLVN